MSVPSFRGIAAVAQGSPSASRYEDCTVVDADAPVCQGQASVADGIDVAVENSSRGTNAVNAAQDEATPFASATAPGSTSASATGDSAPGGPATGDEKAKPGEGLASVTRLPETGGAALSAPRSGIPLVVFGLLVHRLGRR